MPGPEASQPIEGEYRAAMEALAGFLQEAFPGQGFALLVFAFGDKPGARMNYISNATRPEMLTALREFIARNEGTYEG